MYRHKSNKGLIAFEDRAKMCELAFAKEIEDGKFEISDIEKRMGGTSYTINTIRELKRQYPDDAVFYLIIGGDMLFYFDKWYRYEALLGECKVVAAARENSEYSDMCEYAAEMGRIKVLNLHVTEVSSTEIREKLKNGESITGFVPEAVEGRASSRYKEGGNSECDEIAGDTEQYGRERRGTLYSGAVARSGRGISHIEKSRYKGY